MSTTFKFVVHNNENVIYIRNLSSYGIISGRKWCAYVYVYKYGEFRNIRSEKIVVYGSGYLAGKDFMLPKCHTIESLSKYGWIRLEKIGDTYKAITHNELHIDPRVATLLGFNVTNMKERVHISRNTTAPNNVNLLNGYDIMNFKFNCSDEVIVNHLPICKFNLEKDDHCKLDYSHGKKPKKRISQKIKLDISKCINDTLIITITDGFNEPYLTNNNTEIFICIELIN